MDTLLNIVKQAKHRRKTEALESDRIEDILYPKLILKLQLKIYIILLKNSTLN